MKKPVALIFDVDGTLADTEREGHRVAFNRAFKEAGLDWEWSIPLYGELLKVTGGKERIQYFLDTVGKHLPRPARLDDFIPMLHVAKTAHYTRMLESGAIPLRPGVVRLLDEARSNGIRLAIATTTTPANVTALLINTLGAGSLDWFEVIAAGDVVPAKKPAPDIYVFTLKQMGLEPHQCLAFEDSANGVRSALGAGLRTIVTINEYTAQENFEGASLVIDQLGDPGTPFRVIQGHDWGHGWVDVALLRKLCV